MKPSSPESDAPIFVTGMPRSGTTFLQHLLSQHPNIVIHGQEPAGCAWGDWLNQLVDGVDFATRSNEHLRYASLHYAAPQSAAEVVQRFLPFVKWYLTGGQGSVRWGVKSLTQCRIASRAILQVWPQARWVVCIRDPFRSLESLRNTYDQKQQIETATAIQWWTEAVHFAYTQSAAMPILFDQLFTPEERRQQTKAVFEFLEESVSAEVLRFVTEWPSIHQVVPEDLRTYRISECERNRMLNSNAEFRDWVERLGYAGTEAVLK
ncbi:MAG: sulfotransferase [Planctomycetaceae bacterium]